jgi:hypothetical protein
MSIKKGDLVLFRNELLHEVHSSIPTTKVMVVLKGPYEGLDLVEKTSSSLAVVVDLLVEGDLLKGVPTRFLKRTQEVRKGIPSDEIQRG